MVEYFFLWRHSAKSPFPSPNSISYPYWRAYFSFIKTLISSNTRILGKVSSFAQEAPVVASVPWRRSLHDIIKDFWERVLFGVDVWWGNRNTLIFLFLVGENNIVTLTPALKLSEAQCLTMNTLYTLKYLNAYEKWSRHEHITSYVCPLVIHLFIHEFQHLSLDLTVLTDLL